MAQNGCETPARNFPDPERVALIREAFRLELFSVAWMMVEAVVAIGAGIAAHSISLIAFGIDSLIELASAGVLIWRLSVEFKHGRAFSESAEWTASRIAGGLLFALAAYVAVAAGWSLWHREGAGFSWPGLIVSALAIPVMYLLAKRKLSVAVAARQPRVARRRHRGGRLRLAFLCRDVGPAGPARDRRLVDRLRDLGRDPLVTDQGRTRGVGRRGVLRG
jgi:hypothetical protein